MKSRVRENRMHGSVRGVEITCQRFDVVALRKSKGWRNRENKLNLKGGI